MISLFVYTLTIQALSAVRNTEEMVTWSQAAHRASDVKLSNVEFFARSYEVNLTIQMDKELLPVNFTGDVCIEVETWKVPEKVQSPENKTKVLGIELEKGEKLIVYWATFKIRCNNGTQDAEFLTRVTLQHADDERIELLTETPECNEYKYVMCISFGGDFTKDNGFSIWRKNGKYIIAYDSEKQIFPYLKKKSATCSITLSTSFTSSNTSTPPTLNYLGFDKEHQESSYVKVTGKLPPSYVSFIITNIENVTELQEGSDSVFIKHFTDIDHMKTDLLFTKLSSDDTIKPLIEQTGLIVMPTDWEGASKWRLSVISENNFNDAVLSKLIIYRHFIEMVFGGLVCISDQWILDSLKMFLKDVNVQGIRASIMLITAGSLSDQLLSYPDIIQSKGTARGYVVWRMIYISMGPEDFMESMKKVVSKIHLKNLDYQEMLSGNFGNLTSQPNGSTIAVSKLAANYFQYSSYPVVSVSKKKGSENGYVLKQLFTTKELSGRKMDFRYIDSDSSVEVRTYNDVMTCWELYTPYAVFNKSSGVLLENNEKNWMGCEPDSAGAYTIEIKDNSPDDVFFLNYKCVGIYWVKYEDTLWRNIVGLLKTHRTEVDRDSRACIVHNALLLAWAGVINYDQVFDLTEYLKQEDDVYVWDVFFKAAYGLREILQYSKIGVYDQFQTFVNKLIRDKFVQKYQGYFSLLDKSQDGVVLSKLGNLFHEWACIFGRIPECTSAAIAKFDAWKQLINQTNNWRLDQLSGDNIDKDLSFQLVKTVLCTVVREKFDANWANRVDFLIRSLKKHPISNAEYAFSLQCIDDDEKIKSLLSWIFVEDSDEKSQFLRQIAFLFLAEGKYSYNQTFNFFVEKSVELKQAMVNQFGLRLDESQYKQLEELVERGNCKPCKEELVVVKGVRTKIRSWLDRHEYTIQSCIGR